jgi:acyl carrier protein
MTDVKNKIYEEIKAFIDRDDVVVDDDMPLLGGGSALDSMKVVSLCIALEDLAADFDFDFDWASDAAMSRSRSMFRTAGALAEEFIRQMNAKK